MADTDFDFGFTAVDEEELGLAISPTPPSVQSSPELAEINAKLDSLQTGLMTRDECKQKLQAVEKLIVPLLSNLMKNADKPYIKWEGRAPVLSAQIDKITAITRSYGV